jgi:hypothetical protein
MKKPSPSQKRRDAENRRQRSKYVVQPIGLGVLGDKLKKALADDEQARRDD